jgi:hypothetical protein
MMVVNAIDETAYDNMATAITYYKIFPYLEKDFLTREDAKFFAIPSNLPVSAVVNSIVTVVLPAGPVNGVATGTFSTVVNPGYKCDSISPGTLVLEQEVKAKKLAGSSGVEGLTSVLEETMG